MPTTRKETFNFSDGGTISLNVPEGMTRDDVRGAAAEQYTQRKEKSLATSKAASENFDKAQASGEFNKNSPLYGTNEAERFLIGAGQGLTDKWLGAKQLANSLSGGLIGDADKLKAEAAEKERLDKNILDTGMGSFGSAVGKTAPDLLLGGGTGAVAKKGATMALQAAPQITKQAARFLPYVTEKIAGKAIPAAAMAAGAGAEAGATEPSKDYSALEQGGLGAAFGVAGDTLMRGAGRVLSPRWNAASQSVKEHLAALSDLPMLTHSVTDSSILKGMTNALEQVPFFNAGIKGSRKKVADTITGEITGAAGMPTTSLSPSVAKSLEDRLAAQGDYFRAGPDVPLTDMSAALAQKLEALGPAGLSGRPGNPAADKLVRALEASSAPPSPKPTVPGIFGTINKQAADQPGPKIFNSIEQAAADAAPGRGVVDAMVPPGAPPNVPTITAKKALRMRSEATTDARNPLATAEARAASRAIRSEIDDALEATMTPKERQAYMRWKAEYGTAQDITGTGVTGKGHVSAEDFFKTLDPKRQIAPDTPLEKRVVAAKHLSPDPSLAENRSMYTRFLMGGAIPGAGAAVGALMPGDKTENSSLGALGALTLSSMLLGKKGANYMSGKASGKVGKALQSEALRKRMRLAGQIWGGELANDE